MGTSLQVIREILEVSTTWDFHHLILFWLIYFKNTFNSTYYLLLKENASSALAVRKEIGSLSIVNVASWYADCNACFGSQEAKLQLWKGFSFVQAKYGQLLTLAMSIHIQASVYSLTWLYHFHTSLHRGQSGIFFAPYTSLCLST